MYVGVYLHVRGYSPQKCGIRVFGLGFNNYFLMTFGFYGLSDSLCATRHALHSGLNNGQTIDHSALGLSHLATS